MSKASSKGTPQNKALKLTRSIGLSRMEALRATMRWPLRPSQLNAVFCGHPSRAMKRRDSAGRTGSVSVQCVQRALVAAICAAATACAGVVGIPQASARDKAKLAQRVGPFSAQGVPLREAVLTALHAAPVPLVVEVCVAHLERPVTLQTQRPERLDVVIEELARQAGTQVRLFQGHHGEVVRPTLYCDQPGEARVALQ
jgi:hypothetical protein